MRLFAFLGLTAVALVFFCACTKTRDDIAASTIVKVNQESLDAHEFSQQLAKRLKSFDALAAKDTINVKRTKEDIIKEFIVSALLKQLADKNHLTVTEDEVTTEFDRIRKSYPDDISFKAALAAQGLTPAQW